MAQSLPAPLMAGVDGPPGRAWLGLDGEGDSDCDSVGGGGIMADVQGLRVALARCGAQPCADRERVELIGELERLRSAAAAAQLRLTAAMTDDALSPVLPGDARGRSQAVRSVAGQVGLARRISPARAHSFVGLAQVLCADLPRTLAAMGAGEIGEWQATLIAREAVVLSRPHRNALDCALAPALGRLGDRRLAMEARRLADSVDVDACARRVRRAEADRRVSVRPAPGPAGCAMARLTATMPVAQAVAAYAGLRRHAQSARSGGDPRGIGQLMCDELFHRLTGGSSADPGGSSEATQSGASGAAQVAGAASTPDVEVGLVMSERSLLRGGRDPAVLTDADGRAFGHVPAEVARRLVRDADRVWLSRLYADPVSGELVAMDARRRTFTGRLRQLLVWRDQTCRMPWCEAPIHHADHVHGYAVGGRTELANGAGLCQACNYVKEAPGWGAEVVAEVGHVVEFQTPTGHRYRSQAPPAPGQEGDSGDGVA